MRVRAAVATAVAGRARVSVSRVTAGSCGWLVAVLCDDSGVVALPEVETLPAVAIAAEARVTAVRRVADGPLADLSGEPSTDVRRFGPSTLSQE